MRLPLRSALLLVLLSACACPGICADPPRKPAPVEEEVAVPQPAEPPVAPPEPPAVVLAPVPEDPFEHCRLDASDPKWFMLACVEGGTTTTVYATRNERHTEPEMRELLERSLRAEGARSIEIPPLFGVRRTYLPQGSAKELVTMNAAWRPEPMLFASMTCTAALEYEPRCAVLLERVGRDGFPPAMMKAALEAARPAPKQKTRRQR
jgi:hypothetical protein